MSFSTKYLFKIINGFKPLNRARLIYKKKIEHLIILQFIKAIVLNHILKFKIERKDIIKKV